MNKDVHELHNQLAQQTEKFHDNAESKIRHGYKQKQKPQQQEEAKEEEEEQLLPAENLVPLSQTLIPPVLLNLFNLKEDEMQSDPATMTTSTLPETSIKPFTVCSASSASTEVEAEDERNNNSYGDGIGPSPSSTMQASRMSSLLMDQADDAKSLETISQAMQQQQQQQHLSGCKRPMMNGFEYNIQDDDPSGLNSSYSGMMSMLNQQDKETSSNSGGAGSTGGGGGSGGDGANGGNSGASVRTLKRPRLVWTPQLHKRFVDAVTHLGIRNAVPKTIMQLMNVGGLTRENVASHLQKYRLYLRRVQQGNLLFPGTGNSKSIDPSLLVGSVSPTTDPLFAAAAAAVNVDSTSPSIRSNHNHSHGHHHNNSTANHILMPQHMNAALIFQQQQLSVNSPSSAVSPSPAGFHFTTSSTSPNVKSLPNSWPAPPSQLQLDHHHHQLSHRPLYHLDNGKPPPPSPPKLALTLFPN